MGSYLNFDFYLKFWSIFRTAERMHVAKRSALLQFVPPQGGTTWSAAEEARSKLIINLTNIPTSGRAIFIS